MPIIEINVKINIYNYNRINIGYELCAVFVTDYINMYEREKHWRKWLAEAKFAIHIYLILIRLCIFNKRNLDVS